MWHERPPIRSAALAAALILCLPAPARAADICLTPAVEDAPAVAPAPEDHGYRVSADARYRLAGSAQYRLSDDAQYRLADDVRNRPSDDVRQHPPLPGNRLAPPFPEHAGRYRSLIAATARAAGLEPGLLHAVITVESGYDPRARSLKGALGLMQLMPSTAARYAVDDPHDPGQNLRAGARHLRDLLAEFNNDLNLALAAYNAGAAAVRRHCNRVPPYPETRAYVRRVLYRYHDRPSPPGSALP
ncbi:MAG: lytic transglycosylase domain-containing protein [Betaproteobacteria bacterium]|nr:lytic transglycosylase domain-containing protein [Betaproteobacteria bacterium]